MRISKTAEKAHSPVDKGLYVSTQRHQIDNPVPNASMRVIDAWTEFHGRISPETHFFGW